MFWSSPSCLFFFSQGSLCWGKDEGFSTKQEDSCCAAEKCWSVSIFPAFQPLLNTLLKYRTVNVPVSLHTQECSHPCDSSASLSLLTSSFCCRKVKKAKQKSKNKLYKLLLLLLLLQCYLSYPCVRFYSTFLCHHHVTAKFWSTGLTGLFVSQLQGLVKAPAVERRPSHRGRRGLGLIQLWRVYVTSTTAGPVGSLLLVASRCVFFFF